MATTRGRRIKKQMARDLKRVPVAEVEEVLEDLKVSTEGRVKAETERKPGRVIDGNKIPWTYSDCLKEFPVVSFIPEITTGLTYNGVRVQAITGIEMHVPACFKEIYDRSRAEGRRNPATHLKEAGYDAIIELGGGALAPET